MRPERLEDYIGQEHILGEGKPLRRQIERDELTSIILWGPPGVGKTTLAKLIARLTKCEFIPFSAVLSGIKEIKAVMADAERSAPPGQPHHSVHRRDSPLQQSPAGRVPALRRARRHHPDRRHHGESLLRGDFGAVIAVARRAVRRRLCGGTRARCGLSVSSMIFEMKRLDIMFWNSWRIATMRSGSPESRIVFSR